MNEADKEVDSDEPSEGRDPRTLLDVVEEEYPERVGGLFGGLSKIGKLFTAEDWLNLLTRSRSSIEDTWREKDK